MTAQAARQRVYRAGLLRRPVVLVYHAVGDVPQRLDPLGLVTSPDHLESHVSFLRRCGYRFVTAGEIAQSGAGRPPAATAALTFDDGTVDALTVAEPLLSRLGVPATFYVCPGLWGAQHWRVEGESGRLLTEAQARELCAAGMELGSHTMSHPDLRQLDDAALARELSDSKQSVEDLTGRPCRTFAYPFGAFDERVERAAGRAGYDVAFAWEPGRWRPLAAPRLPAPTRYGARRLALKMMGVRRRRHPG